MAVKTEPVAPSGSGSEMEKVTGWSWVKENACIDVVDKGISLANIT